MKKFEKVLQEYTTNSNVTINPETLQNRLYPLLKSIQNTPEGQALGVVAKATEQSSLQSNPIKNFLDEIQKNPQVIQSLKPEEKEMIQKILFPEQPPANKESQTGGQNPSLDAVQKQQSPVTSSNSAANKVMR